MNIVTYKTLLAALIILVSYGHSFAITVKASPVKVLPGDVVLLEVMDTGTSPAEVEFLGNKPGLYPLPDNRMVALFPVDINTNPGRYSIKVTQDDTVEKAFITVRPHKFKTIKLTLPKNKVTLAPEDQKRAVNEAEALKEILSARSERFWYGRFNAPTDTEISEVFGVKRIMNEIRTSVHRGIDYRGKKGTPVRSINAGKVVLTDDLFFGGNTVVVDHGTGLYSIYMHLSKTNVSEGDEIVKEQVVGLIGSTGRATGPHLHMSVKLDGISINPESLMTLDME